MKTEGQMKGVFYVQLSTLFARDKKWTIHFTQTYVGHRCTELGLKKKKDLNINNLSFMSCNIRSESNMNFASFTQEINKTRSSAGDQSA